jgi:hypothetical protein
MGSPYTSKAKLVSRDASVTTAKVTDAMARWLLNETDAEDFERADRCAACQRLEAIIPMRPMEWNRFEPSP